MRAVISQDHEGHQRDSVCRAGWYSSHENRQGWRQCRLDMCVWVLGGEGKERKCWSRGNVCPLLWWWRPVRIGHYTGREQPYCLWYTVKHRSIQYKATIMWAAHFTFVNEEKKAQCDVSDYCVFCLLLSAFNVSITLSSPFQENAFPTLLGWTCWPQPQL